MKAYPIFIAEIQRGQVVHRHKKIYDDYLMSQFKEGAIVEVSIKPYRKDRTANQNSYYWLYLRVIEDETGNASGDLHEFFKRKFLPPRFITVMKETIKIPASTTKLSVEDMSNYMDKIQAETGIPMPVPEWE